MAMRYNKLRYLLDNDLPTVSTRLWSPWAFFMEVIGSTGNFDYTEFVAEYAPFDQRDLEDMAMAAELHEMGSMIKVDFFNRGYIAQKAIAAGFQAILFADHRTPEQVEESVKMVKPETPEDGGMFGFPNRRFIGTQSHIPQMDHAKRLREVLLCFMVEKECAVDRIDEICSVPGVDMIQFGPSDYCMSRGWNRNEHIEDLRAAERRCIESALKHGVRPRCEIQSIDDAQYYIDLKVKHFSLSDQLAWLKKLWIDEGGKMRNIADELK